MNAPSEQPPEPTPLTAEETVSSRRLYEGTVVRLRVDRVRMPSGREAVREVVEHSGAVVLVAVDAEGQILLVRQYRHPIARPLLELPAGTLDGDEEPEACAARELQEETGFRPGRLQRLGRFLVSPGYSTEYIHAYLATDLEPATAGGGDEEEIQVLALPLAELLRMVETGELEDAKSVAALFLYLRLEGSS
jgi:ADP-ribose pyrophosphatase